MSLLSENLTKTEQSCDLLHQDLLELNKNSILSIILMSDIEKIARLKSKIALIKSSLQNEDILLNDMSQNHQESGMDLSRLYFDELLASCETLTGIADQFGSRTLADLMYLQSAIMQNQFIDVMDDESNVIEVVNGLPSSKKWMSYIKIEHY